MFHVTPMYLCADQATNETNVLKTIFVNNYDMIGKIATLQINSMSKLNVNPMKNKQNPVYVCECE